MKRAIILQHGEIKPEDVPGRNHRAGTAWYDAPKPPMRSFFVCPQRVCTVEIPNLAHVLRECVCVQDMGANQPPPQLHAHEGRHGRPEYTRTRQNTQTHTLKSNFKFNSIATPSRERTGYAQHPGCEKGSSLSLYCTTAYASPIVEEKSAFTSPPAF